MAHRVDRIPRYHTEEIDAYGGPTGELLHDLDTDELVLQNTRPGGVRLAKKADLLELEQSVNKLIAGNSSIFSVRNYGAVGNGNTDDTAAIQAAVDAAGAVGGGVVFLPAGTYLQSANISLHSNVSVIGLGRVEFKRIDHSCGIMFEFTIPASAVDADDAYQGLENIVIRNIIFNCNGVVIDRPRNEGGCEAIAMGLNKNVIVEDCDFLNRVGAHTIEVSGCKNVIIRNCRFYGAYEHRDDPPGDREHIQIEYSIGGAVVTKSHIPYSFAPSENITVESCYFGPSKELPTGAACIGCHNAIEDRFSAINVDILNCKFDTPEKWAIAWYVSKDYVVDGCEFICCPMAVRAVCVRNNVDRNGVFLGHGKAPDGLVFTNNYIEGRTEDDSGYSYYTRTDSNDEPDVRIRNVIIANNVFKRNGGGHIALRFHYDAIIVNNVFRGTTKLTVSLLLSNMLFKNNYCNGHRDNGIWCGESDYPAGTSGLSRNVIIQNNVFVGDHTAGAGRSINLHGNGDNTGLVITGNVIRSSYISTDFSEPININNWNYVTVFSNTIYRTNSFNTSKSWIGGLSTVNHMSIGANAIMPFPNTPDGVMYGSGGRATDECAVTGNLMIKPSGDNVSALRIYGASISKDCLSLAGVRFPDSIGYLAFGTEDIATKQRKFICQVGNDYDGTTSYLRLFPDGDPVRLGTGAAPWEDVYTVNGDVKASDARMKMDVQEFSDEFLDAWGDIEFRSFLFTSAVQEKGEQARRHAGVLAQQAADALKQKGFDPEKYGFFCYDKWEETPAYPAGDRYGIRYAELLVIEAAWQRREIRKLQEQVAELLQAKQ